MQVGDPAAANRLGLQRWTQTEPLWVPAWVLMSYRTHSMPELSPELNLNSESNIVDRNGEAEEVGQMVQALWQWDG